MQLESVSVKTILYESHHQTGERERVRRGEEREVCTVNKAGLTLMASISSELTANRPNMAGSSVAVVEPSPAAAGSDCAGDEETIDDLCCWK